MSNVFMEIEDLVIAQSDLIQIVSDCVVCSFENDNNIGHIIPICEMLNENSEKLRDFINSLDYMKMTIS